MHRASGASFISSEAKSFILFSLGVSSVLSALNAFFSFADKLCHHICCYGSSAHMEKFKLKATSKITKIDSKEKYSTGQASFVLNPVFRFKLDYSKMVVCLFLYHLK